LLYLLAADSVGLSSFACTQQAMEKLQRKVVRSLSFVVIEIDALCDF